MPRTRGIRTLLWITSTSLALAACGGGGGGGSSGSSSGSGNSVTLPQLITASLIVDVNGDGRNDILIGNGDNVNSSDLLLINNADGSLTAKANAFPPHFKGAYGTTVAFATGDFNKDGKTDVLAVTVDTTPGNYYGSSRIQLYLGNGDGTFTDASSNISHGLWPDATINSVAWPVWLRVADLDGDGFPDFIAVPAGGANPATPAFIYLNDGTGHFSPAQISITSGTQTSTSTALPNVANALIGDLDGDGRLDVMVTGSGQPIIAYLNRSTPGHLNFIAKASPSNGALAQSVLVNLNGDHVLHLIGTAGYSGSQTTTVPLYAYVNDGTGVFHEDETVFSTGQPGVVESRQLLAGDLTSSGRDSVFVADHGWDQSPFPGERSWYLKNDGAGHLADATASNFGTIPAYTHGAALGDLHGNGYIDVFMNNDTSTGLAASSQVPRFWKNDGKGNFTSYMPVIN